MSRERICDLVVELTEGLRKGPLVEVNGRVATDTEVEALKAGTLRGGVVEVYGFPSREELQTPSAWDIQDLVFIDVGVHKRLAATRGAELRALIEQDEEIARLLGGGPSYIHLGGMLGSQDLALLLMAVGAHLGWWRLMTLRDLDPEASAEQVREFAGRGLLYAVGFGEAAPGGTDGKRADERNA